MHSWEPSRTAPNNYWQNHDRFASTCQSPSCWPLLYQYKATDPNAYSYHFTQPFPQNALKATNEFWNDPLHRQRYPNVGTVQPGIASNLLYNEPAVGAYALTRGACVTKSGCFDETTSNSCLYQPFYAGVKCDVAMKLHKDKNLRSLADGPGAPINQQPYKPWENQNELYDTLLDNWKYNRPGYNE